MYATCSLLTDENEQIAAAFSAQYPDLVPVDARQVLEQAGVENAGDLTTPLGHLRLWPNRHATDGFYAAAWERKA